MLDRDEECRDLEEHHSTCCSAFPDDKKTQLKFQVHTIRVKKKQQSHIQSFDFDFDIISKKRGSRQKTESRRAPTSKMTYL